MTANEMLMQRFERRSTMRLIDTNDPVARRKAAIHYAKIAKQAQRQAKRRAFFNAPHFAFIDMIAVALLAALFSAGLTFLLIR